VRLVLRADANYKGKTMLAANTGAPAIRAATTTDGSWIVNARVALADVNIAGKKTQIAAWGRNLFDNRKLTNSGGVGFLFTGNYERARTYGVDLSVEF
jgi:iron complex outermembrane receptor protein